MSLPFNCEMHKSSAIQQALLIVRDKRSSMNPTANRRVYLTITFVVILQMGLFDVLRKQIIQMLERQAPEQ